MIAVTDLIDKSLYDLYNVGQQVLLELDLLLIDDPQVERWQQAQTGLEQWLTEYEYAHKRHYPPTRVDALWLSGFNAIEAGLEAIGDTGDSGETFESGGL